MDFLFDVCIDVKATNYDGELTMYEAEAELGLNSGTVYLSAYTFSPESARKACENALRELGYEGEVVHV